MNAAQALRPKCVGIVSPWPKVKNAEYEVIERMKSALTDMDHQYVVIDGNGDVVEGHREKVDETIDLVISLHFISAKLWSPFTYLAMWNPLRFYHDALYPEVMKNVGSYDDYLLYDSEPIRVHLKNYLRGTSKQLTGKEISFVPGCSGDTLAPSPEVLKNPRIFYCGINWERMSKKHGRHHELLKMLDDRDMIQIFGPVKFEGVRPWKGFKNFKGDIPFDGRSVLERLNQCGVSLVLSSDQHRLSQACSSRIYESCAAGAVVISDENAIVRKEFGDSVLYIQYGRTHQETFDAILEKFDWIKRHPDKSLQMAQESQRIYRSKHTMELGLKRILDHHEQRVSLREQHVRAQKGDSVDLISYWPEKSIAGLEALLVSMACQDYEGPVRVVLATDHRLKQSAEDLARKILPHRFLFEIVGFDFYDANMVHRLVPAGQLFFSALKRSDAAYVVVHTDNKRWFPAHVSSLIRVFEDNSSVKVALASSVLNSKGRRTLMNFGSGRAEFGDLVNLDASTLPYAFAFQRDALVEADLGDLYSVLESEVELPLVISALKRGSARSTHFVSCEANADGIDFDLSRVCCNYIRDFFGNDDQVSFLQAQFPKSGSRALNFHNMRRVFIEFYAKKLKGTRLYPYVLWVYRRLGKYVVY